MARLMRNTTLYKAILGLVAAALISAPSIADAKTTRIKDIVQIEGVRENMLVGYGLVVGLNGSGDSLNNSPFTQQSLIAMLERRGTFLLTNNPFFRTNIVMRQHIQ